MRPIAKVSLLSVVLVLAASIGLTAQATAKKRGHQKAHLSSAITVDAVGPEGVSGKVSGGKACRAERHLTLYRVNSGPSVPSGEPMASTWTVGDGSWAVPGPLYPSEYFAVLDRKSARGVVCESATSNSLGWG